VFGENERISQRQLGRQAVLVFLGLFVIIAPSVATMRGRLGMISCILGTLLALCYLFYLSRMTGAYRNPEKNLGKVCSKIVACIYSLYLILSGGFIVRLLSEIVKKYLITNIHLWLICGLIVLVAAWGTGWNIQRRARIAEVAYPVIIAGFALLLIFAAVKVPLENLKMSEPLSAASVARGTYQYFAGYSAIAVVPFIMDRVQRSASAGNRLMRSIVIVAVFTLVCLLVLGAAFGSQGIAYRRVPILDVMSGVNLPGEFLQRFDIVWISLLLFVLLFAAGSTFFYANHLLERVQIKKAHIPLALLVLVIACISYNGQSIVDIYAPALQYVCAPVLLVLSLCMPLMQRRKK